MTVDWDLVPEACGYFVLRSADGGRLDLVDHRGGDLLAVPGPPYADTSTAPGMPVRYAVRPVYDPDEPDAAQAGPLSGTTAALADGDGRVTVAVDARRPVGPVHRPWRDTIGSEHLRMLLSTDEVGGEPMGAGLETALTRAHRELGVGRVRAHGLLGDDLGVYREVDGQPMHDFSGVDRVLDRLGRTGLRPVLELSFMPRALARDTSHEISAAGVASPPRDWDRWSELVGDLVSHLRRRVGDAELATWAAEVWNEPDLGAFWDGTQEDYLRLYDVSARAVKRAAPMLPVGGPATAATHWVEPFLAHVARSGSPLDFVSTHVYGSPPLDLRPLLAQHGHPDMPLLWTEWGVTPTHFAPVNDSVLAAAFLATGMRSAAGRVDALAPWVASDHFEELGRPPALVHGGFGLLSVGGLGKPRWWALLLLEQLADAELRSTVTGDGAGSLVQAWPSLDEDTGRVAVAIWNGTLDQGVLGRDPAAVSLLDREVLLRVDGLPPGTRAVRLRHVADAKADLAATVAALGVDGWPDAEQWASLRAVDRPAELPHPDIDVVDGRADLSFRAPMPSVWLVELVPR